MKEIILDTLLDGLKLLPFLFVSFLLIELLEHKFKNKSKKIVSEGGKYGPIFGSLLGAIPQCGFSCLATNLYITRVISLGTLISIYLSTSDEMLPILISSNAPIKVIIFILLIKIVIGMLLGFMIDLFIKQKEKVNYHLCEDENCHCDDNIIKSSIIHTLKIFVVIIIVTFILNYIMSYINIDSISNNIVLGPIISSLIGLIPNCASSVVLTELYLNEVVPLGSIIGGLLTNSGVALIILFKQNKNIKENLFILSIIYFVGVISGIIINLI